MLRNAGRSFAAADRKGDPMKRLILAASLAVACLAHAQVTTEWVNEPGGVSVASDRADNVITARGVYAQGGDIFVAKRNSAGTLLWESSYDNTDFTTHELATWVGADSQGNALVAGTIRSGYANPVNKNSVLMKFDPQGKLLWRIVYDRDFDGSSTRKLLIDGNDDIYVLGLGTGPAGQVTTVRKFDTAGNTLWTWYDPAGIGAPQNFKFTRDGAIVIAARGIYGSINGFAKISTSGSSVWSIAPVYSLTVGDAAGDADGNTYLVNGEYVAGATGSMLRKVSPTGATLWEKRHDMAAMRVEVGSDNLPVLSGFPNANTGGAAFMKYDAAGNVLWTNLDADGPAYGLLAHAQTRLDRFDNAYLAAGTMSEMAVTRVNKDGTSSWTSVASFGYAYGIDFGSDNAVYVVGGTTAKFAQRAATPTDLKLAMEGAPTSVTQGGSVTYRSTVTNLGPAPANSVTVTGTLPGCSLGALAVGASASCSRSVTASAPGTLSQTMTARSAEGDTDMSNNTASVSTQVLTPTTADLRLTLSDTPDPVRRGGTLTYMVSVSNAGPAVAGNVSVTDTLPTVATFVSATASQGSCSGTKTVSCAIGTLNSGANATVTIRVAVGSKVSSLTNSAQVASSTTDPSSANNSASATTTVTRK